MDKLELTSRPSKTWHIPPGVSKKRDRLIQVLKRLILDSKEIKISAAYLSNMDGAELELGYGELNTAFNFSLHKISLFQLDCNPGINGDTARKIISMFGDKLRVVTTNNIRTKSHHKVILFYFENYVYHLSGSMNFTKNGICNNGESITITQYTDYTDYTEAESIFTIYESQPQLLFNVTPDFKPWISFVEKIAERDSIQKRSTEGLKDPVIHTAQSHCHKVLNGLFSTIGGESSFSHFVNQVHELDIARPNTFNSRRQSSLYLQEQLRHADKLDMNDNEDQIILKQILAKLKKGKDGIEFGALGVIHFTNLTQPDTFEALTLYQQLVLAIRNKDLKSATKINIEIGKISGRKVKEPSIGLFSRISSIAHPTECFTYNGSAKVGIDYILEKVGFTKGRTKHSNFKVNTNTYYDACNALQSASFLLNRSSDIDEDIYNSPMHYLDLILYNS